MPEEAKDQSLALFQNKMIRQVWYKNVWYFTVVDITEILTEFPGPAKIPG
jgi:hypothetical protein